MKNFPVSERPRERLLHLGTDRLSTAELLAILLGSGTTGKTAIELAQELLVHFGGLSGLYQASVHELQQIRGMGQAKAIGIKSALSLSMRLKEESAFDPVAIRSPEDLYNHVERHFFGEKREKALVVLLDTRQRAFHTELIGIGSLTEVVVHPREIFAEAVRRSAKSLVLVHNHPSGDPSPSDADIQITKVLIQSGNVMGISIRDHIIVGKNCFASLKELGVFTS
ncbi:MAG: hypothetical protein S4CHLAM102_09290 [Chlamydiia bacterium]|nr:hypothetical protein [Chlamydiia bacterium]